MAEAVSAAPQDSFIVPLLFIIDINDLRDYMAADSLDIRNHLWPSGIPHSYKKTIKRESTSNKVAFCLFLRL